TSEMKEQGVAAAEIAGRVDREAAAIILRDFLTAHGPGGINAPISRQLGRHHMPIKKRTRRILLIILILLIAAPAAFAFWLYREMRAPASHAMANEYIEIQ